MYSERLRVLDGRALKKQVIGYAERTMAELVEAYVNLDLPLAAWDLEHLVGKVKEFIHLLEDRSSVFHRQERSGWFGRCFSVNGLHSMTLSLRNAKPVWTVPGDRRITHVSLWLRRLRLDELLQLINVSWVI